MKLHHFAPSSASYRVRIALNLKGLDYQAVSVHLRQGEQHSEAFRQLSSAGLVPVLEDPPHTLTQSLAIIEYLDERYPEPPLLPRGDAGDRALVRALALSIACDIHPLNNLRVLNYLIGPLDVGEGAKNAWARHWIGLGFAALEARLAALPQRGDFCFGDTPTLADICLVPQILNAARVDTDMAPYPILRAIDARCRELSAFQRAHPAQQVGSVL
ncbi:maleylacetoacetate isomerase [Panacagrimonas sp.]|uniref:maleylacetoacetate isomerase n=1 Tax=Panacagrimonas sp. TaxID=2480088 RepID=UPI003B518EBF